MVDREAGTGHRTPDAAPRRLLSLPFRTCSGAGTWMPCGSKMPRSTRSTRRPASAALRASRASAAAPEHRAVSRGAPAIWANE